MRSDSADRAGQTTFGCLWQSAAVTLPRPEIDPDGLLEYSVVFTDRSLNHMSTRFVGVMQDIIDVLATTYRAETVAVVPGGGTYAMEAVARQLATGRRCLVVRNGLFSYRWSAIFEAGSIPAETTVCQARQTADEPQAPWTPAPIAEVVEAIERLRPEVVVAAHVETAAGILLPDDYVRAVTAATHAVGGLMVLDCIASGAMWVDMTELGVDVLISAPQKGWSGSPGAGYVMLSSAGRERVMATTSTSFAVDLQKWLTITEAYTQGQTPYHATLPTDGLAHNAALMLRDPRPRAGGAAGGADRPRHTGPGPAGRARLPVGGRAGVRRSQRGRRVHRRSRDPQRGQAQAERPADRRRRPVDVR